MLGRTHSVHGERMWTDQSEMLLGPEHRTCSEPAPVVFTGPAVPLDRSCSTPGGRKCRRYVAYAGNPFRADFHGHGTVFLPRSLQAHLDEQIAAHDREADFHEVLEEVEGAWLEKAEPVDDFKDTLLALLAALTTNTQILMPFYVSLNGVLVFTLVILVLTLMCDRSTAVLHRCLHQLEKKVPVTDTLLLERDYAFVAHHSFGKCGQFVVILFYTMDYWTSIVALFVILENIWRFWLPEQLQHDMTLPLLVHSLVSFMLLYVPSSVFKRTQMVAVLSTFFLVVAMAVQAAPRVLSLGLGSLNWTSGAAGYVSAEGVVLQITAMLFAYGNVSILPKVTVSWHSQPEARDGLVRTAFWISALAYVAFGLIGASAFQVAPPDAVFRVPGVLGVLCQICFLVRLQLCLPLLVNPCVHVLHNVFGIKRRKKLQCCFNLVFLLANAAVALAAGGQMDGVTSMIGACITTSLVTVFPMMMDLRLCEDLPYSARILDVLQACTGVCLAGIGVLAASKRLDG